MTTHINYTTYRYITVYFIFLEVSKINTTINKYWLIYLFQILIAISLMKLVVVQKDKSIVYRKYLYICVDTFKML
ncbi:hypothetical protein PFMC_06086 [Plasmodium falciparum CAMP/Malaysia]|uniref:Uncharacterized protein n=1 Tax=Plasmodium falciparum (isolate Camp / Malaysia) TaxID=5835 RepID=A0A024WYG7_PLAFC|nr:hypothetical protein PFMC_06086 [Plasmodium falciparum CAMP/Malaysia]